MSEKDFKEQEEKMRFIGENVSDTSRLLQAGEECAELIATIFKYLRKMSADNPTPKTKEEIVNNIKEELTDVLLCVNAVGLFDNEMYQYKLDRWVKRLKESKTVTLTDINGNEDKVTVDK